jgi:ABC-type Na+ transport system ATPase subunit NatA
MVVNALELYMSREDKILNELKELRAELRSIAYSSHMIKQPE